MKEELVTKLIEKSLKYLNTAEAFASKEVPLFVRELLEFKFIDHMTTSILLGLLTLLVLGIGISLVIRLIKWALKDGGEAWGGALMGIAVISIVVYIPLMITKVSCMEAYKAKYAPRVYLMDYARGAK